jgi:hypothetical protein
LEVEEGFAGDVAEFLEFDGAEAVFAGFEGWEVVEGGVLVFEGPGVPEVAVGLEVVVVGFHKRDQVWRSRL